MTKREWLKLAEAVTKEERWFSELYEAKIRIAKKHGGETDFVGNDVFAAPVFLVANELLGDDFNYWLYECGGSFADFNMRIELKSGAHPSVYSLGELYEFAFPKEDK